jgi:thioesterase domain-containing protein
MPLSALFDHNTVSTQAQLIERLQRSRARDTLVRIRPDGDPTVVLVHPVGGHLLAYRELVSALPEEIAVHGIQSPPPDELPESLQALAELYAQSVATLQSGGPVHLVGWSMGGVLSLEAARALEAAGTPAASVTLLDSFASVATRGARLTAARALTGFFRNYLRDASTELPADADSLVRAVAALQADGRLSERDCADALGPLYSQYRTLSELLLGHRLERLPACPTHVVQAAAETGAAFEGLAPVHLVAPELAADGVVVLDEETHFSLVSGGAARHIAAGIAKRVRPRPMATEVPS